MKPETLLPLSSPEQRIGQTGYNLENAPLLPNPEIKSEQGAERYEQSSEARATISDIGISTTLPTPVIDDNASNVVATIVSNTPLMAKDEDLIEKEWVNKAKKIVAETRDNPHQREEAVNKLQIDYLKKRYGRELGVAE